MVDVKAFRRNAGNEFGGDDEDAAEAMRWLRVAAELDQTLAIVRLAGRIALPAIAFHV